MEKLTSCSIPSQPREACMQAYAFQETVAGSSEHDLMDGTCEGGGETSVALEPGSLFNSFEDEGLRRRRGGGASF